MTRRLIGVLVGVFLIVAVAAVLVTRTPPDNSGTSDQAEYQQETDADRQALIGGYLMTRRNLTTDVGRYTTVSVAVCGPATVACRAQEPDGEGSPTDVGGRLAVTLRSAMPGDIRALSSEEQPVTADTDMASWRWEVRPAETGDFRLTATVRVLRADSDTALLPDRTFDITLHASLTAGHVARQAWAGITSVAGLLTTLGVTISGVVVWLVRRRREAPTETPDTPYL